MATVPTITLNNGVEIPQLGFGVFQIKPEETAKATATALEIGYRHIDTAQMYGNEKEVGEAIRDSGIDRERDLRHQQAQQQPPRARRHPARRSTRRWPTSASTTLDLFLIHWPLPAVDVDYVAALEGDGGDLRERAGHARSASPTSTRTTCATCSARPTSSPAVNQIEVQPVPRPRTSCARSTPTTRSSPRPGRRSRRARWLDDPVIVRDRRAARPHAGAGHAALAHAARRRRLPEVGDAAAGSQENFDDLRLRARRGRHGRDHRPGPRRAHRPEPGRRSTTSPS